MRALGRGAGGDGGVGRDYARLVGLYNYPVDNGHVVTEEYIDGQWELFDPSFGSYYTADPTNTTNPVCLSYDQMQSGMGSSPSVQCVVTNPLHLNTWPGSSPFLGPAIYEQANPGGPIGPEYPMVFPLSLDLTTAPVLDQSMFGPAYLGADYIGGSIVNYNQLFTITGLTAGQTYNFTIVYSGFSGTAARGQTYFQTTGQVTDGGTLTSGGSYQYAFAGGNSPWVISFTASSDTAHVLLTNPYTTILVLYAQSYTISTA